MTAKHVVTFSGGVGSWGAARQVVDDHGARDLVLLFADTKIEDADLYRFLIEAAANVLTDQAPPFYVPRAEEFPPMFIDSEMNPAWFALLDHLRSQCQLYLPQLVWIAEGRTPWQVFNDRRFIGNSRVDPCSEALKRKLMDGWRNEHCDPQTDTIYVGIDWSEEHRLTRLRKRVKAWNYQAPLCNPPYTSKAALYDELKRIGITRPRLYDAGFPHNNCGGFCIKAGQAHFALLLKHYPDRYAYHEAQEEALRAKLGGDYSVMKDRRNKRVQPLTMRQFRERIQSGEMHDLFDFGGCGCALE